MCLNDFTKINIKCYKHDDNLGSIIQTSQVNNSEH